MLSIYSLFEQQVEIEAENPGLLEVPKNRKITSMSLNHFKELIKEKGWEPISKGLVNLQVWNKNKNPGLSAWARRVRKKLKKWVDENDIE